METTSGWCGWKYALWLRGANLVVFPCSHSYSQKQKAVRLQFSGSYHRRHRCKPSAAARGGQDDSSGAHELRLQTGPKTHAPKRPPRTHGAFNL
eukprot:339233-Amphidinium_carterae.1